jgi:hypothetical protein
MLISAQSGPARESWVSSFVAMGPRCKVPRTFVVALAGDNRAFLGQSCGEILAVDLEKSLEMTGCRASLRVFVPSKV